jgi:hypothetical protein
VPFAIASRALRRLTGEAWVFDPVGAAVRIMAVIGALAIGLATDHVVPGALVGGGAFFVGFGAPIELFDANPLLLCVVSLLSGAAAIVGSVAAARGWLAVAVVSALGALCGIAARRTPSQSWIAVQCGLAGILATSYPTSFAGAVPRALFIVAGGLAQAEVLLLARKVWRRVSPPEPSQPLSPRYALQLAIALGFATFLERAFQMRNGYWVPMTTLLVLRPGTRQTLLRAISRTIGTVGGAALASAAILAWHPSRPVLAAAVAVAAAGTYVFHRATYGLFSAFITMYAVAILAFTGQPERGIATARIVATLVGAAIGLGVQLIDDLLEIVNRGG